MCGLHAVPLAAFCLQKALLLLPLAMYETLFARRAFSNICPDFGHIWLADACAKDIAAHGLCLVVDCLKKHCSIQLRFQTKETGCKLVACTVAGMIFPTFSFCPVFPAIGEYS